MDAWNDLNQEYVSIELRGEVENENFFGHSISKIPNSLYLTISPFHPIISLNISQAKKKFFSVFNTICFPFKDLI